MEKNENTLPNEEDKCHCILALFSGGCLLGAAGAADFVPGSLSSCFTTSVGASGSFFTSTAIQLKKKSINQCYALKSQQ